MKSQGKDKNPPTDQGHFEWFFSGLSLGTKKKLPAEACLQQLDYPQHRLRRKAGLTAQDQ